MFWSEPGTVIATHVSHEFVPVAALHMIGRHELSWFAWRLQISFCVVQDAVFAAPYLVTSMAETQDQMGPDPTLGV